MASKKELQLAYILAISLFIIGVLCYAAFPAKTPDRPLRILFKSVGGNVLFDHKTHAAETGYAISCGDCHHTLAEDEYEYAGSCMECHELESDDEDVPKRSDAFHMQCIGCHEDFGAGARECAECHVS
jgi:hypothetical protein